MAFSKARRLADLMGAGDATIPAGKLAAKAVAYSKIQDVSDTDLILGTELLKRLAPQLLGRCLV